jgi:hypothetical protein
MVDIIARTREVIADPAGAAQTFSAQAIQDELDRYRQVVRYGQLDFDTNEAAITGRYLDYFADVGDWETDALLYSLGNALLTPATSDYLTGHWTFAATTYPPVYIVGQTYDVYRAAASLIRRWAARVPSKKADLDALLAYVQTQARPRTLTMTRDDAAGSDWGGVGLPIPFGARSR